MLPAFCTVWYYVTSFEWLFKYVDQNGLQQFSNCASKFFRIQEMAFVWLSQDFQNIIRSIINQIPTPPHPLSHPLSHPELSLTGIVLKTKHVHKLLWVCSVLTDCSVFFTPVFSQCIFNWTEWFDYEYAQSGSWGQTAASNCPTEVKQPSSHFFSV